MNSIYHNDLLEIVQSLDDAKPLLKGKKIFLTGGTGFLGSWLVDSLLMLGAIPTLLTRNKEKALASHPQWKNIPQLQWVESDLNESPQFLGGYDQIIHAANDMAASAESSAQGSRIIFDFAEKSGASTVLFLSSGAIHSPNATNDYTKGKVLIEREGIDRSSSGNFQFKIARCFSFLGPYQDLNSHFAAPQFFKSLIDGRPIVIQGDGSPIRSFLYPTDFAAGALRILLHGKPSHAYDLGSNEPINVRDLAELINRCREGEVPPVSILNQNSKSLSQSNIYLPDLEKIQKELGFEQKIKLREAVTRTAKFYQEIFPSSKIRA